MFYRITIEFKNGKWKTKDIKFGVHIHNQKYYAEFKSFKEAIDETKKYYKDEIITFLSIIPIGIDKKINWITGEIESLTEEDKKIIEEGNVHASELRINKVYIYNEKPVYMIDGSYLSDGRISNYWYWCEILEDGKLGEIQKGYARSLGMFKKYNGDFEIRVML